MYNSPEYKKKFRYSRKLIKEEDNYKEKRKNIIQYNPFNLGIYNLIGFQQ